MRGSRRTPGWRLGAPAVISTAVLLAGCSGSPDPQPSGSTSAPSSTAPVTTSPTVAPTTPAIPTYTPPPSRNLRRPAGVAPVKDTPCAFAVNDAQFYQRQYQGDLATAAQSGQPVAAADWADAVRGLSSIHGGTAQARAALKADGVPTSYVAYKDLADLDRAMAAGLQVAKNKDDSKVLQVYFDLQTAMAHTIESCGALER